MTTTIETTPAILAAEALNRVFQLRPEAVEIMAAIIDRAYTGRRGDDDE